MALRHRRSRRAGYPVGLYALCARLYWGEERDPLILIPAAIANRIPRVTLDRVGTRFELPRQFPD